VALHDPCAVGGGHACGGETALICVSLSTVKDVASAVPNLTAVAPVKLRPLMTTLVPPAAGPLSGLMLVMNGPQPTGRWWDLRH
jgi:hypothetical protein